jgi:hypothetical protein
MKALDSSGAFLSWASSRQPQPRQRVESIVGGTYLALAVVLLLMWAGLIYAVLALMSALS